MRSHFQALVYLSLVMCAVSARADCGSMNQKQAASAAKAVREARQYENQTPANYGKALQLYRRAAEQGSGEAMYQLGQMYSLARGVPQDAKEWVKWVQQAAECGYPEAQVTLGSMYMYGPYVPRNPAEGQRWWMRAAEQGSLNAQAQLIQAASRGWLRMPEDVLMKWFGAAAERGDGHILADAGEMYDKGTGVPRDLSKAAQWYRAALEAKASDTRAAYRLGEMYEKGEGVPQDYGEAAKAYQAAERGGSRPLVSLAKLYATGRGVPQNLVEAYKIYSSELVIIGLTPQNYAFSGYDKEILSSLNEVTNQMTPQELGEGQRRAREWQEEQGITTSWSGPPSCLAGQWKDDPDNTGFAVSHGHWWTFEVSGDKLNVMRDDQKVSGYFVRSGSQYFGELEANGGPNAGQKFPNLVLTPNRDCSRLAQYFRWAYRR